METTSLIGDGISLLVLYYITGVICGDAVHEVKRWRVALRPFIWPYDLARSVIHNYRDRKKNG